MSYGEKNVTDTDVLVIIKTEAKFFKDFQQLLNFNQKFVIFLDKFYSQIYY